MNAVAIIPARGGSKRFKRKNIALLNDRPLVSYPIAAAIKSGVFEKVIVSTEDSEITEIAAEYGADTYGRSDVHATDTAHELDACLEVMDDLGKNGGDAPEYFCVIYPTAVFVEAEDLQKSYKIVQEAKEPCVIMCVSGFNYHPYKTLVLNDKGYLEMMFPVEGRERSQSYPHAMASNGTFYWVHAETLRQNREKGYYQDNLLPYEIPAERAIDIDHPEDLNHVKRLLKLQEEE